MDEQTKYNTLFNQLASTLRTDTWEVRQETPPQAYLHVSKKMWGDEKMNGIHLEAYVLGGQLERRCVPVMVHCEGGCPYQRKFMELFVEKASKQISSFPGGYTIKGPNGSNACQVDIPFGETPEETVEKIKEELCRLQTLAPVIDECIALCLEA